MGKSLPNQIHELGFGVNMTEEEKGLSRNTSAVFPKSGRHSPFFGHCFQGFRGPSTNPAASASQLHCISVVCEAQRISLRTTVRNSGSRPIDESRFTRST